MNLADRYQWAVTNPSDIAEHVPTLLKYGKQVKRITEFGVRAGVSTTAWLAAFPSQLTCYDKNVPDCLPELVAIARDICIGFDFVQGDTRGARIAETDLLFLDTTHNDETLGAELWNNHHNVTRFTILHDTELFGWSGESGVGIKHTLIQFLLGNPQWRIVEHFHNSCGLTVLERA